MNSIPWIFWPFGLELEAGAVPVGLPLSQQRRKEKFLPGMWSNRITNQRAVVASFEAVLASILLVSPTGRQVVYGGQFVIDDSPVTQPRPDRLITICL
jgi:hypothetical protein